MDETEQTMKCENRTCTREATHRADVGKIYLVPMCDKCAAEARNRGCAVYADATTSEE